MYVPDEHSTETSRSVTGVPSSASASCAECTTNEETVTGRAGISTSSPSRTREYERLPLILMALTFDGTCMIAPDSRPTAASMSSRARPCAAFDAVSSPSASSVTVVWPSRIVPTYSFSVSARWPSSLVARSMPRTSTPVAIGSSVPACPTRRVRAIPRIFATTSCEVKPDGLSTMTRPARRPPPPLPESASRSPLWMGLLLSRFILPRCPRRRPRPAYGTDRPRRRTGRPKRPRAPWRPRPVPCRGGRRSSWRSPAGRPARRPGSA